MCCMHLKKKTLKELLYKAAYLFRKNIVQQETLLLFIYLFFPPWLGRPKNIEYRGMRFC